MYELSEVGQFTPANNRKAASRDVLIATGNATLYLHTLLPGGPKSAELGSSANK